MTENVHNNEKWCRHITQTLWLCFALALIGDFIIIFIEGLPLTDLNLRQTLIQYIFPYGISACLLLIATAICVFFTKRKQFVPLYAGQITCISLICGVFVWSNSDISLIPILFILPLIFSLIYIRVSVLVLAFVLNLLFFTIYALLNKTFIEHTADAAVSTATMYVIIIVVFCISMLILFRLRELAQTTLDATNRAKRDSLTGLYNHASFYEYLDIFIQQQLNEQIIFSLAVTDIDNFKTINDTYGHGVGDKVIVAMVEAINANIEKGTVAFRYGGEEFAVLTPGDALSCLSLTEKILADFRSIIAQEFSFLVTASAGISEYSVQLFSGRREFFASADEALYKAKRTGKDKCVIWEPL